MCFDSCVTQHYLRGGLRFWPQLDTEMFSTMALSVVMVGMPSAYQLMRYGPYPIAEAECMRIMNKEAQVDLSVEELMQVD